MIPTDMNLLTMVNNSSHEFLKGRPQYFMQPSVPNRGAHYAVTTVKSVLQHPESPVSNLTEVDDCLIHTGSKKILDGVCSQLDLRARFSESTRLVPGPRTLRQPFERVDRIYAG